MAMGDGDGKGGGCWWTGWNGIGWMDVGRIVGGLCKVLAGWAENGTFYGEKREKLFVET